MSPSPELIGKRKKGFGVRPGYNFTKIAELIFRNRVLDRMGSVPSGFNRTSLFGRFFE